MEPTRVNATTDPEQVAAPAPVPRSHPARVPAPSRAAPGLRSFPRAIGNRARVVLSGASATGAVRRMPKVDEAVDVPIVAFELRRHFPSEVARQLMDALGSTTIRTVGTSTVVRLHERLGLAQTIRMVLARSEDELRGLDYRITAEGRAIGLDEPGLDGAVVAKMRQHLPTHAAALGPIVIPFFTGLNPASFTKLANGFTEANIDTTKRCARLYNTGFQLDNNSGRYVVMKRGSVDDQRRDASQFFDHPMSAVRQITVKHSRSGEQRTGDLYTDLAASRRLVVRTLSSYNFYPTIEVDIGGLKIEFKYQND